MSSLIQRVGSRHWSVVAALALILAGLSSIATASAGRADSGTAWVSANHAEGSVLWVSGDIKDKILGRGAIVYQTKVSATPSGSVTITAKTVTIFTKNGSLSGSGSATQSTDSDGNTTVTDGHVRLTKGTGKLKGHSLVATFSGPLKDGIYTFTYKGTYK